MTLTNIIYLAVVKFELNEMGLLIFISQFLHLLFVLFTNTLSNFGNKTKSKSELKPSKPIFLSIFEVNPSIGGVGSESYRTAKDKILIGRTNELNFDIKSKRLASSIQVTNKGNYIRKIKIASYETSDISTHPPKLKINPKRESHSTIIKHSYLDAYN